MKTDLRTCDHETARARLLDELESCAETEEWCDEGTESARSIIAHSDTPALSAALLLAYHELPAIGVLLPEATGRLLLDGTERWFRNGQLHRVDGPAITYSEGTESWYLNGQRHRVDGPAVTYRNGTEYWYLNGQWRDRP